MSVNVALLGSGLFATNSYLPALTHPSNSHLTIHTLWSRSEGSVSKLASKLSEIQSASASSSTPTVRHGDDGLEAVFNDAAVDAVMFVLPITTQPELIRRAWQAGKHVLSEKPVAKDVKSAQELIKEYEEVYKPKGLIWKVAENYEFDPLIRKAGDIVKSGKLGPVFYYNLVQEGCIVDGTSYQATQWRTIPDYQGGFLLDGGVHLTSMLRTVLPQPPQYVISTASLHRTHLPPHDTLLGLALPSESATTAPHGPPTQLETIRNTTSIPTEIGTSSPSGTITLSFSLPDTPPATRAPQGLVVTCKDAVLRITNQARVWTLQVIPGANTGVEALEETQKALGVETEVGTFARVVKARKDGGGSGPAEDDDEKRGDPRGALWDLAVIQAMLNSNGQKKDINELLA